MRLMQVCAAVAVLWAGSAAAIGPDSYDDIPYFGASYLYELPDSDRDSDNGQGFQLHFGLPLQEQGLPRLTPELTVHSLARKRDVDGKKDYQTAVNLDLIYDLGSLGEGYKFKPYLVGGLGVVQNDVRGNKHERLGVDFGAGLMLPLAPWLDWHGLAARVEARALVSINDDSTENAYPIDYRVTAGLQLPLFFLFPEHHPVVPAAPECELAVVDPDTGRADCSADSDHDSVPDSADQCPGTVQGMAVDSRGCPSAPAAAEAPLLSVQFQENSSQLDAEATKRLDSVASTLQAQANLSLQIIGNADSQGDKSYNLMLSQERADAVRQYLIGKGIDGSRLVTSGRGEFYPVASNASPEGRAENRRVEFKLIVP
ncbi:OmpA family protein [Solimonas aquatica]|uniref:OmpA family protein n=1 Tax=Solimonas aquatica TaxID=489703 RepID=A0A1H9KJR5_9GAMM|nr:OmpA family protein [Solimonas aquatica]SEQ99157.1 OmpA family protein [Solimonas aquatica]